MTNARDVEKNLKVERERLLSKISLRGSFDREIVIYGSDSVDKAMANTERARNAALRHNAEHLLVQVEAALNRCEKGAYGVCDSCGERIDPARLRFLPSATLCIKCRQDLERLTRWGVRRLATTANRLKRRALI